MPTAIINIKVEQETKAKAQKVAKDLGFSLSALINAYLRDLVRTKEVHFGLDDEVPNQETIRAFREVEEEMKSPEFKQKTMTPEQALNYVAAIIREKSEEDN